MLSGWKCSKPESCTSEKHADWRLALRQGLLQTSLVGGKRVCDSERRTAVPETYPLSMPIKMYNIVYLAPEDLAG